MLSNPEKTDSITTKQAVTNPKAKKAIQDITFTSIAFLPEKTYFLASFRGKKFIYKIGFSPLPLKALSISSTLSKVSSA